MKADGRRATVRPARRWAPRRRAADGLSSESRAATGRQRPRGPCGPLAGKRHESLLAHG